MLNFKKYVTLGLALAVTGTVLTGCGPKKEQTKTAYTPKELKVQFVPSQAAETLEAKAKPLEKLLGDKLGIPVKVSVSTNYNTIIEAMSSKQVDVGFLPPTAYVLAHDKKAADVLLQAQRYGVKEDGSNTDQLVDNYKAMIVVKKNSTINSIQDLKGKKIAWQDVTSTAGYIYPAAEMKKAGVDPEKDVQGVTVKGHDKGVIAVLNGDVDAAAVFEDARNNVKKDFPNVFNDTKVIYRTQGIPNDTIAVRSDMDEAWKDKISQAFIDIAKDPDGQKIVKDIYTHVGYVKSSDKNFDVVREYQKAVSSGK
ncbi:phosphate/phosphite/phosphonate ABC transporter substrate-binding protein [Clostridium sp. YIM B02515]|uniref:Phosphate/phosphite/phosphonate ABC transporter substrate-binding protein n=1 Tax=Clostridium rhizosphaerae TaxID=2803861 RepID=A0ABS1TC25_9CLOT|nr:phosphate/phosphite/phosphonate ABC transporter substrate-binding protein [Clostridium rhizosphaerae]MBL4936821.1 phosphate/phosphite/phosphonate ABC transporter substrate-binding protein [Clostridium rhizosphaerae]